MIKNLRLLRQQNEMSQQQLADVLGISQQSVNKYENHNIEPDIATLIKLADYFGVSVDYLIGKNESDADSILISADEKHLLEIYKKLNSTEKICIKTVIETLNQQK